MKDNACLRFVWPNKLSANDFYLIIKSEMAVENDRLRSYELGTNNNTFSKNFIDS